jgi:UrcA family protein
MTLDASLTVPQSIFNPLSGLEAVRASTVPLPLQIRAHNQEMDMKTATWLALASCIKAPTRTIAALALCALLSTVVAADPKADTAPVTRSAKASLADLDLSTPEGMRTARERIHQTARHLCNRVSDELDLSHHENYVACVDETSAAALQKIIEPALAEASSTSAQAAAKKSDQPAHSATESRTSKVSLSDLNLATSEGARVARERLHREARRLCNQVADELDLSRQPNFVACVEEALAKALRQIAPGALVAGAAATSAPQPSHP